MANSAVEEEPYAADGGTLGVDLGVDVDDPRGPTALCEVAFSLAEELRLSVFDPQLGRVVTAGEKAEIRRQLEQTSSFSQAALVTPSAAPTSALPATVWVWLVLIGAAVLLYLVSQLMTCGLLDSLKLSQ